LSAGRTALGLPVYIGDYLADTMHLSTEQHGAYLLLLFHLWRRRILPDDDVVLAQITGLDPGAWSNSRAVLAEFFEIHDGLWHHGRVEQERSRAAAKQQSNSNKAKLAAYRRWNKPCTRTDCSNATPGNASGTAGSTPSDAKPEPLSEPELLRAIPCSDLAYEKRATRLNKLLSQNSGRESCIPHLPLTEKPVMSEMVMVNEELSSTNSVYQTTTARKRSLGAAILLAAIDDYRSTDDLRHKDAGEFLYPQTFEGQKQYNWAVGLTEGLNPTWLRDALDRCKRKWDRQRAERKAVETRERSRAFLTQVKRPMPCGEATG
jgi:uncharacterized protein YdaU (DUF1376 family)